MFVSGLGNWGVGPVTLASDVSFGSLDSGPASSLITFFARLLLELDVEALNSSVQHRCCHFEAEPSGRLDL